MAFREFNKFVKHFRTKYVLLQTLLIISIMLLCVRIASAMSVQSKTNTPNESEQPHVEKLYEMYIEELTSSADDNHAPLLVSVKETVELYLPFHKNTSKNAYSCQEESVKNTCVKNETDNHVKTESSIGATCEYQNDDDDLHESDNNGDIDDEIFTYPAGVELVWLYLTKRHNLDELE